MEDLLYKIAITRIPSVGAVTARNLISYCGSPRAVFEARKRELLSIPGVGEHTARNVLRKEALLEAETEIKFLEKHDIQPLFYMDEDYPGRLRHYPDCPILLYYRGKADLNAERIVAIVGTRRPTPQGRSCCEALVEGLLPYNVLIVSGLAFGIDITAHRQCLKVGVPTVGVLGHGLNRIYPPQHLGVAEQMIRAGGLLTEYPSHVKPDREHFPMRNRIIAGMCDALVVVETARRGGSMISAEIANSYNKDVFAVPGRLHDRQSMGCNHLIKTHKAALLESADDIGYIMRWEEQSGNPPAQPSLFVELTEEEKIIVDLLRQVETASIDELTFHTQMVNSAMASLLLNLEFKGLIKTLPGKRYTLLTR
jgi:DNA processing protein